MLTFHNTGSTKLERRQRAEAAWLGYTGEGITPVGIETAIEESWKRSRERYGIDPGLQHPLHRLEPGALEERRRGDDVFPIILSILHDFSSRLGDTDHVLAYFDAEGFMLSVSGDQRIADRAREEIDFSCGTSWAESSAGTNGPGLALATGQAAEVFATEHWVLAWQPWSCAAAPVLVPGSVQPVGVVGILGPWEVHRRQSLQMVKAIARAVEERVIGAVSVREEVIRHALRMAEESGGVLVAVDLRGRILAANDAAARRQIVSEAGLAPAIRGVLATAMRSPAGGIDPELRFDAAERGSLVLSMIRHTGVPVGALLRLVQPATPTSRPRGRLSTRYDFGTLVGRSIPFRRSLEQARNAAGNDLPVVLSGESGTGKELFAHSIHAASGRSAGPFVAVNCASIPAQLVEAELFGYEPGSFSGARREGNAGRFEDASGGTVLLDEVSELPLPAQSALLRVLQEREVVRLGGSATRPVDVRVLAATNKPLAAEVELGRFRRDLYYRLNVLPIEVPPLRERGDDIALLAEVFLSAAEAEVGRSGLSLTAGAVAALRSHPWPGNVRELKNVILRAAATAPSPAIGAGDVVLEQWATEAVPGPDSPAAPPASPPRAVRRAGKADREELLAAIAACGGNFTRAAARLGISRMTMYRWARKHGIATPQGE